VWHVRVILVLLLNAAIILFAIANLRETVVVRWWNPHGMGTPVSLTAALVVAYLLGFFTLLVVSAYREIRLRRRCGRLERQMHGMREELDALRTASFEEPPANPAGERKE